MGETNKIIPLSAASDNHQNTPSVKSKNSCSDATVRGEDNCLNLYPEVHQKGASCSKKNCGSAAVVKIEEVISGVASTESCSQNEASRVVCRNANGAGLPPVGRSSSYHGVTRHRWSGKYEAHLWDNTCRIEGHRRKGRQVYLGSYTTEEKAARAYDVAALKFWGSTTKLNFPVTEYEKELEDVRNMSRDACVTYIRRRSSCFSRGTSAYRGVTKRRKDGRWQARIGLVCGSRDIYLGTFKSEEEAAEAYDVAAVKLRGRSAITNFDISNYVDMSPDNKN